MVSIFYIILVLLLILHTILSLKKNKFLGLIVPHRRQSAHRRQSEIGLSPVRIL